MRFQRMPECLQGPQIDITGLTPINPKNLGLKIERHDTRQMAVEVLERNPKAPLDQETLEALLQVAAWKCVPPIEKLTRTGWVGLTKEGPIKAVKVKGIGLNKDGRIAPPKQKPYHGIFHRLDFEEDGEPILPIELVDPYGGMSLATAKQEWTNTLEAQKHGVSALTPIALCQYPNLKWDGEPMAALMLGSASRYDIRLNHLVYGQRRLMLDRYTDPSEEPIELFMRVYKSIGENLKKIHHKQKKHTIQPHTGNFSYNPEARTAVFHDLEQLYPLDGDNNINALRMANDISSVILEIIKDINGFGNHTKDIDDVKDLIRMFLIGYFGRSSLREIYEFTAGIEELELLMGRYSRKKIRTEMYKLLRSCEHFRATKPSFPPHKARSIFEKADEIITARSNLLPSNQLLDYVRDGLVDFTQ